MIKFDENKLFTPEGDFEWKGLTRITMMPRDRITLHDIYYKFEFGKKHTILYEDVEGVGDVISKVVLALPNLKLDVFDKIWKAKVTTGDYIIYEK